MDRLTEPSTYTHLGTEPVISRCFVSIVLNLHFADDKRLINEDHLRKM